MTPARAFIAAVLLAIVAVAQETENNDTSFDEVAAFLDTHSSIVIDAAGDHPRESIATAGKLLFNSKAISVEYRRKTYQSGKTEDLKRSQMILYMAPIAEIDPVSVSVQNAGERAPGIPFWMVSFTIRQEDRFFGYNNHIYNYGETKDPQVFTSKGKSRQVILGYVSTEALANELAEKFRAFLKSKEAETPAGLTRPDQSAA